MDNDFHRVKVSGDNTIRQEIITGVVNENRVYRKTLHRHGKEGGTQIKGSKTRPGHQTKLVVLHHCHYDTQPTRVSKSLVYRRQKRNSEVQKRNSGPIRQPLSGYLLVTPYGRLSILVPGFVHPLRENLGDWGHYTSVGVYFGSV